MANIRKNSLWQLSGVQKIWHIKLQNICVPTFLNALDSLVTGECELTFSNFFVHR